MVDFYKGVIPILDYDRPADRDLFHPRGAAYGAVPRDYSVQPQEMFAQPEEMELIPESEWDARYDEQEATKSSLEHIYLSGPGGAPAFVNLDQNGQGYCWSYSVATSIMMARLVMGLPLVRLSAHAVACKIKGFRDEGGWCGLSAEYARRVGYPSVEFWPEKSMSRANDKPEVWANAALYKTTEEWCDLTKQAYDQNLTKAQCATCGFMNIPGPRDYNHWSHSVSGIRWVRISAGNWGQLILNSWAGWGRHGLAVLQGSKAICNGGLGIRSVVASM
jgi:hypothetical protein